MVKSDFHSFSLLKNQNNQNLILSPRIECVQIVENCKKKKIQEDQDQQGGGEESLVLQEEDQLLTMQPPLSL